MNEKISVLFISDIHYSNDNILNKKEFLDSFINSVSLEEDYNKIDVLLVAGDICDKGGSEENYEKVVDILNDIIIKLNIKKTIIVPGNHDVNRNILMGLKGKKGIDSLNLWKYNEKYEYFEIIKNVINLEIDINKVIVSYELIENNFLFMGINTNYKIGENDGIGFIDTENLEKELKEIKEKYKDNYNNITKIAIMHHNPRPYNSYIESYEGNNSSLPSTSGNFDLNNWNQTRELFVRYGIRVVLTGHVHGSHVESSSDCEDGERDIYYSSIGSIGMNFNQELLDIVSNINLDSIAGKKKDEYLNFISNLKENKVNLSISNHHNTYSLMHISQYKIEEQHFIYLTDEGLGKWIPWFLNPKIKTLSEPNNIILSNPFASNTTKTKKLFKDDIFEIIMEIIRKQHLYKTGHFHWGSQCVMNWIDTSVLLTNSEYFNMISDCIIKQFGEIIKESDGVIGLGLKGAILMSGIRYAYPDKKYSFYPENCENYNEFEKCVLNGENMDRIILMTDVVHSGETVKKFVRENGKYINKKIDVITIFFTDYEIKFQSEKKEGEEQRIDIELNYIIKMPIRNCGKNKDSCNVFINKLDIVFEM